MTIYDIAEAAGVSASTVSRVINNKKGVRRETKERVLKYLELFQYSPNETARSLVNQASKIIGILVADLRTTHHTDGIYYMEREFVKLGYCCIIMNTGTEEEDKARYIQILRQRRAEAAVLIGSTFQSELVKQAIEKYLPTTPVIIANGYLDLPNVYGVIADEHAGVTNCVKLLVDRGRRNLAFVIDNLTPSNMLKQLGFETGVRQWCDQTEPMVMRCAPSLQGAYDATKQLVKEHPEVDGIMYAVDLLATGGIRALRDMKMDVPGQVAVIGVDNSIYGEICFPSLTSLDNKLFDLSVAAARNLMDVLQKKRVTKNMMIISSIVEREST
jgi:LacI family transcriptional regulator